MMKSSNKIAAMLLASSFAHCNLVDMFDNRSIKPFVYTDEEKRRIREEAEKATQKANEKNTRKWLKKKRDIERTKAGQQAAFNKLTK